MDNSRFIGNKKEESRSIVEVVRIAYLSSLLVVSTCVCQARVKLPPVLSSYMVLQQHVAVPIWGTATPNEALTICFRNQKKTTTADASGKWQVKLNPLPAGGPDNLTVIGKNTVVLTDVLVGEVWVGSGQSNMGLTVNVAAKGDSYLKKCWDAAPYPRLRLSSGGQGWKKATAVTCSGYSAQLLAFGLLLQQELKVPVGLMLGAQGSSPSGYWLSEQAYRSDADCRAVAAEYLKNHPFNAAKAKAEHQNALRKYQKALSEWNKLADDKKRAIPAPRKPIPPVKPGDSPVKIGRLFETYIRPMIPFAIRGVLWDQGESGTYIVGVDQYTLMGALIRGWRQEWGQGDFPFIYVQKPSGGGCAFTSNSWVTKNAAKHMPVPATVPDDGGYREMHIRIMSYPHTGMVITSDLGSGVHPLNKYGYASRAARVALGMVYGRKVEYYGPLFKSLAIERSKIRIQFTHIGRGLALPAGQRKLQGFAIAGQDKKFLWADALIDRNTVVVSNARIARPRYVRYAWSRYAPWANLFNKDGLPAIPFRTDR